MRKLYKRTATGAIQVWWQEQQLHCYRTHSGQVGGQIVTSAWTEATAKNVGRSNETTPTQQAALEVKSNYDKKIKEGYLPSIEEAEASTKFKPMLAKNYEDYATKVWRQHDYVYTQPKFDGIRCIATARGLFSRMGNPIVATPHVLEALRPVFRYDPKLIIDGELYNHDLREDFNAIVSLTKKTKLTDLDLRNSEEMIEYHVFDVTGGRFEESSTDERLAALDSLVGALASFVVPVRTVQASSEAELDACYGAYLDAGYEGQMIRLPGPYEQKRSGLLLKRKEFVDSEFIVVDIEEGVGNAAGGAKIAHLKLDTDPNRIFKADITGTVAERRDILLRRNDYIGGQATVKYFKQRTPDGIPRFGKVKAFHVGRRKM